MVGSNGFQLGVIKNRQAVFLDALINNKKKCESSKKFPKISKSSIISKKLKNIVKKIGYFIIKNI